MLREALELQVLEQDPEQAAGTVGKGVAEHGASAGGRGCCSRPPRSRFRRMVSITDEALDLPELLARLALDGAVPEHRLELLTDILTAAAATAGRHPPVRRRAAHPPRRAGPALRRLARAAHRPPRHVARHRGHRGRGASRTSSSPSSSRSDQRRDRRPGRQVPARTRSTRSARSRRVDVRPELVDGRQRRSRILARTPATSGASSSSQRHRYQRSSA